MEILANVLVALCVLAMMIMVIIATCVIVVAAFGKEGDEDD